LPPGVIQLAITLVAITPGSATVAASVKGADGKVWSFKSTSSTATVDGVAVAPAKLVAGMKCVLIGTEATTGNTIDTLACQSS
jgi:hypothetical protein